MDNLDTTYNKDLAEETFLTKWPDWIRWLLFLPASIIVPMLFLLIQSITTTWFLDIGPNAFYLVIMRGVAYGAGFVYVGSLVAPHYQKAVAIILLVLLSMFVAVGILAAVVNSSPLVNYIEDIIMLISGGYVTYHIFHEI